MIGEVERGRHFRRLPASCHPWLSADTGDTGDTGVSQLVAILDCKSADTAASSRSDVFTTIFSASASVSDVGPKFCQ